MTQGIVIGTTADGSRWVDQLYATLRCECPVVKVCAWELDCIAYGAERFDEFVFLPQSTEIIDNDLWRLVFTEHKGRSVSLAQHPTTFGMYLGKYRSAILRAIDIPAVHNKHDAIYWEDRWMLPYLELEPDVVTLGDLPHSNVFAEKFGRLNMVVESPWLRRYKGSWNGLASVA